MRRGLVGLVAGLRLTELAWVFRPSWLALRFRGRVLPLLAGLGRMKVNSKVPPIARVCVVGVVGVVCPDLPDHGIILVSAVCVGHPSAADRYQGVYPPKNARERGFRLILVMSARVSACAVLG